MIIYVDLLIMVSFLTNGSIFYIAGKLCGGEIKLSRIILADILAVILTVGLLSKYSPYISSIGGKLLASVVLAYVAYPWRGKRFYFRQLVLMLLTASMVSSLCLLSQSLTVTVPVTAGVALNHNRPTLLNLLMAIGLLGAFTYYHRKIKVLPRELLYEVDLYLNNHRVCLRALADTGNRLRSMSGKDVILGYYQDVEEILPDGLAELLANESLSADRLMMAVATADYAPKMQLISYYTIDQHSFLVAIRLDKAVVYQGEKVREFLNPILAFAPRKLGEGYELIIPPELLK